MKTGFLFLNESHAALDPSGDGWSMLAPFGDFPGTAHTPSGPEEAMQRVDRAAGEELVRNLKSFTGRAARFFRAVPLFRGHPDAPGFEGQYPDGAPKGGIDDLEVRDDGIWVRPSLNEDGAALINGDQQLGLSAFWDARRTEESDSAGRPIYRPYRLRSAGLTPTPNLPVPMLNDASAAADGDATGAKQGQQQNHMDRTKLLTALTAAGITTLANDASDDAVAGAIRDLGARAATGATLANEKQATDTALANAKTELATTKEKLAAAETTIANERTARRDALIDTAIQTGRITAAEKGLWERRLNADFTNESTALAGLAPKVKVTADTTGDRKADGNPEVKGRDRVIAAMDRDPKINGADGKA